MDMLSEEQITAANLRDWRKLGQGLDARFIVGDLRAGTRFLTAVSEALPSAADHLEVRLGRGRVDLKLISDDAIYRDGAGTQHRVEWVTQEDVDLAHRIKAHSAQERRRPRQRLPPQPEHPPDRSGRHRMRTLFVAHPPPSRNGRSSSTALCCRELGLACSPTHAHGSWEPMRFTR
jgi:pterin-4a-carbinolamine dehydratase